MNKYSEVYATDFGWSRNFPMRKESDVHETLKLFLSRFGIQESLISDGARALIAGKIEAGSQRSGMPSEDDRPAQPIAELCGGQNQRS